MANQFADRGRQGNFLLANHNHINVVNMRDVGAKIAPLLESVDAMING